MQDLDSFMDDLESMMEEPESGESRASALVAEFVPLNRRRFRGNPPLSTGELDRWSELRELLEYQLSGTTPPLSGTRRRMLRVPTTLKVRTAGRADEACHLCDLCEGGAFIESTAPLEAGASLEIEMDPGGGAPPLRLAAVVKWRREIPNMDGPAGMGVEFSDLEDGDFEALAQLVESLLAEAGRSEP